MARIPRMIVKGEEVVYHVVSRSALDGFVLGDVEKEFLLNLIKGLSALYLTEVFGFCIMGNHFHLLVRMKNPDNYTDKEIRERIRQYDKDKEKVIMNDPMPVLREKLSSLSEYVKEIKQCFTRYYNKLHGRNGFFWSGLFKSVIVEDGDTLINCLAYIDLNPLRANIVERPEDYRWNSLGYHMQRDNDGHFLSTDFGLLGFSEMSEEERVRRYYEFVYENGVMATDGNAVEEEGEKDGKQKPVNRLRCKTRYFTDSGIIGSKDFINSHYGNFKDYFSSKHEKKPKKIKGLDGVYSLKRLFKE